MQLIPSSGSHHNHKDSITEVKKERLIHFKEYFKHRHKQFIEMKQFTL